MCHGRLNVFGGFAARLRSSDGRRLYFLAPLL
jgi:hypothetical protein